jgi:hypothetical protein
MLILLLLNNLLKMLLLTPNRISILHELLQNFDRCLIIFILMKSRSMGNFDLTNPSYHKRLLHIFLDIHHIQQESTGSLK